MSNSAKASPVSFDELKAMDFDKLMEMAEKHVKLERTVKTKQEKLTTEHKTVGKVIAAAKVQYASKQDAGEIDKGLAFRDYHNQLYDAYPNNHAEACANAFNQLVLTKKITEEDYDLAATDWLEKASAITKAVKNDLNHKAVKSAVNVLKKRPGDTAKQLRQTLANVKGKKNADTTDGKSFALNPENVYAVMAQAFDAGLHVHVINSILTEIANASKRETGFVKELFNAQFSIGDAFANAGLDNDKLENWAKEWDARHLTEVKFTGQEQEPAALEKAA